MIRTVLIALSASLLLGSAALAAPTDGDHSGFGRNLFATRAPSGFDDPRNYSNNMDVAAAVANDMEPAAGKADQPKR